MSYVIQNLLPVDFTIENKKQKKSLSFKLLGGGAGVTPLLREAIRKKKAD